MAEKEQKNDYIERIVASLRKIGNFNKIGREQPFNNTEMRLLGEIAYVDNRGGRIISTELANAIGVTRSAISQIVNKLEAQGIVVRVPSDTDRKRVYIELTESAKKAYNSEKQHISDTITEISKLMGEKDMATFVKLLDKFADCQEKVFLRENKFETYGGKL